MSAFVARHADAGVEFINEVREYSRDFCPLPWSGS